MFSKDLNLVKADPKIKIEGYDFSTCARKNTPGSYRVEDKKCYDWVAKYSGAFYNTKVTKKLPASEICHVVGRNMKNELIQGEYRIRGKSPATGGETCSIGAKSQTVKQPA